MRAILWKTGLFAAALLSGCAGGPSDVASEQQARGGDGAAWEWPLGCFDPDTSEPVADCPDEALHELLAILRLDEQRARANDIDLDGIPNELDPDVDGDGLPNESDYDIDGDGIPNGQDADADGDGKSGQQDPDEDGDGLSDRFDLNDDGDGLFDDEDLDDDGDGDDEDDDDGEEDDDDDDEDEPPSLDDLVERQREGTLTDDDRAKIAGEIAKRLGNPQARDQVLQAIQSLANRSDDLLRDPGIDGVPAPIQAVDAVYDQLGKSLRAARRAANLAPGKPTTDAAVREAMKDFLPRVQALDDMSKAFELSSIRDLGNAVSDLRAGLGSADRARDFTKAVQDSAAANPFGLDEKAEIEKLTTGAAILGRTFDKTSGRDLADSIRLIDVLVDTPDELADALRDVRDLGQQGVNFDDAVNDVIDRLIGVIGGGSGNGGGGNRNGWSGIELPGESHDDSLTSLRPADMERADICAASACAAGGDRTAGADGRQRRV